MNSWSRIRGVASQFLLILFASFLVAYGCGSGGGGGDEVPTGVSPPPTGVQQGVFVDSAVEGINYKTATESSLTDTNGTFKYAAGETVTFSIADVELGQAVARGTMTPCGLVPGATDETDPEVTNICRLLQSLDVNGDLNDGITISAQIRNEVEGRPIDFDQRTDDFGNDPYVTALFDALNAIGAFTDVGPRTLRTAAEAQDHMRQTLNTIKQLTISDLDFPSSVIQNAVVDGSVAYTSTYVGAYDYIANPVMALRWTTPTFIETIYVISPALTVRDGRISFLAAIPDDISGTRIAEFRLVDYDDTVSDNWQDTAVSNVLQKQITIR